jgi:hypothetical protein
MKIWVADVGELEGCAYSGHSGLMDKRKWPWQDVDYVLGFFGVSVGKAKKGSLNCQTVGDKWPWVWICG